MAPTRCTSAISSTIAYRSSSFWEAIELMFSTHQDKEVMQAALLHKQIPRVPATHFLSGGLMKNARILGLVLLVLTASLSFAARAPKSKVFGSAHDFKTQYNGASYTLCNFCHIAHKFGSAPTGPSYLLWNHTLSTVATYGTYTSDTMVNQPVDLGTTSNSLITSNLC